MNRWLHADGLTVRIGARTLLHELQLQVAPGEAVAVLGENGAGKSTLLACLPASAHAAAAGAGRVRLDDRVLHR